MNTPTENTFITSVIVADRVGLLRDVTRAIFSLEGNIGAIRQTLVDGFFSLVFTSTHPADISIEALKAILAGSLEESAVVTVLNKEEHAVATTPTKVPRYVVTTRGADKPGTICAISSFLVDHNVNIEDWIVDEDDGEIIYIAQVAVPESIDFRTLQSAFKERMAAMDLSGMILHENIFRATNEIGAIKPLIG